MTPEDGRPVPTEELETRLRVFIERELLNSEIAVDRDADLLSGDLLDSVGALRLASFVAEEFGLTVEPKDFVVENFRSIAILTEFVERKSSHST